MQRNSKVEVFVAEIRNAGWWVRHYRRARRSRIGSPERGKAIYDLGIVLRRAFRECDDFEALLTALYDGLTVEDYEPPF